MANYSNTAYDMNAMQGLVASRVVPAMRALKKLMQEDRVTQSPAAQASAPLPASLAIQTIETRFGAVEFNFDQPILFTRGLLGMPEHQRFALADFPNPRFAQFKLLQCLDDTQLSFITLPLDLQPSLIREEDLKRACEDVGMAYEALAVLLMVTVHRSLDKVVLSVNARAPLLIDADQRQAVQYVFSHDRYPVQQPLSADLAS